MIARLIGIIGKTQGVRFSAKPPISTSSRMAKGPRPSNQLQPAALSGGAGDPASTPLQLGTALSALDIINDISLLVAPESVSIPDLGVQREVVQQAVTYCEARPHLDLFYIADPPFGLSVQDSANGQDVYHAFAVRMSLFIAISLYAGLMVHLLASLRHRRRGRALAG